MKLSKPQTIKFQSLFYLGGYLFGEKGGRWEIKVKIRELRIQKLCAAYYDKYETDKIFQHF